MGRRRVVVAVVVASSLASVAWVAAGQPIPSGRIDAGVAQSGMGQGTASVTTRSDVRMAIESAGTTGSERLEAIGAAVARKMGDVRACYSALTARRPEAVGSLRFRIALPSGRGAATYETTADRLGDADTAACVMRAVRGASLQQVQRPAMAVIALEFSHSGARSAIAASERRAEVERSTQVETLAGGRVRASGQTAEGEVRFVVTGSPGVRSESVAALARSIQAGIGAFLDCRRRAGRRGRSPAGEVTLTMSTPASGSARGTALAATVADPEAGRCLTTAVGRVRLEDAARGVEAELVVTYTGEGVAARSRRPRPRPSGVRADRRGRLARRSP
ncbi:MAG: hypothetical protein IT379_15215 [Deltaproteobacteria bacterium]|nr:hypothetical protein [Deltaproteobacteria bacterium]